MIEESHASYKNAVTVQWTIVKWTIDKWTIVEWTARLIKHMTNGRRRSFPCIVGQLQVVGIDVNAATDRLTY